MGQYLYTRKDINIDKWLTELKGELDIIKNNQDEEDVNKKVISKSLYELFGNPSEKEKQKIIDNGGWVDNNVFIRDTRYKTWKEPQIKVNIYKINSSEIN
jgi:hypothetical protein